MKKHILLVDDNKDELNIFLDALRQLPYDDGFKCTFACGATQAKDMLKLLVPDFIFIGLNITGIAGEDLLSFLMNKEQLKNTELCFYSPYLTDELRNMASRLGVECIQKTNSIDTLAGDLEPLFTNSIYSSAILESL